MTETTDWTTVWTTVALALLGFGGILYQSWRYDRVRREDRKNAEGLRLEDREHAREDARAEVQRGNQARWIAEVESYVNLVNGVIGNMRVELALPKASREWPGREQLQPVSYSMGVASAAARLLDPAGTLVTAMWDLWGIVGDLQAFSTAQDESAGAEAIRHFLDRAVEATQPIMRMLGTLREESA